MKNLIKTVSFIACAFLITGNTYAQRGGGHKAKLEQRVKSLSKQVHRALKFDADQFSKSELRETAQLLRQVKNVLGLSTGPGNGRGNGGGGGGNHYAVCEVKYTQGTYSNYYSVYKDGQKFSNGYAKFADAAKEKEVFVNSGACQNKASYQLPKCSMEYVKGTYSNYYQVKVAGEKFSGGYAKVEDAAKKLEEFANAQTCQMPKAGDLDDCKIDLINGTYSNNYYVMQNGQKLSGGYARFSAADNFMAKLEDNYMCSKY